MEASLLVLFVALFVFAATWMVWRGGRPGGPGAPPGELSSQLAVLGQRLTAIEGRQTELRDGLQSIGSGVTEAGALTTGLRDATEGIRSELNRARDSLTGLESATKARRELEDQSARSLRRLEQVIAGTASKGGAGENMVDLVFSRLPVEWQVRDFRVGNRTVEFGLRLPNGLVLPIDSKWPATNLLESFLAATEPAEQARLKAQLESVVTEKAREVRKYLDPDLTTGFALAVLPDAVDELCGALKADCLRLDVVLIGQGMLVPYLLLVFQTV
ncbi:MAG: DNA recombination protein RmuC, partial [Dehalococcoidia bacterium]